MDTLIPHIKFFCPLIRKLEAKYIRKVYRVLKDLDQWFSFKNLLYLIRSFSGRSGYLVQCCSTPKDSTEFCRTFSSCTYFDKYVHKVKHMKNTLSESGLKLICDTVCWEKVAIALNREWEPFTFHTQRMTIFSLQQIHIQLDAQNQILYTIFGNTTRWSQYTEKDWD